MITNYIYFKSCYLTAGATFLKMDEVKNLTKRRLELLSHERPQEIYRLLLLREFSVTVLSKLLYPEHYNEKIRNNEDFLLYRKMLNPKKKKLSRPYDKTKPHPVVSKYLKAFHELGWARECKKEDKRIKCYKATLKPYFEYREKFFNQKFSNSQKKIIENQFNKTNLHFYIVCLKRYDALEYIDKVVEKMLFDFFFLLPITIKDASFNAYADLSLKYYDDFALKLFRQMILNKLHEIDMLKYKTSKLEEKKISDFMDKIDKKIKSEK